MNPLVSQPSADQVFVFPSPTPYTPESKSKLTEHLQKFYDFAFNNKEMISGEIFLVLSADLSKKDIKILTSHGEVKLEKIRITSFVILQSKYCPCLKWEFVHGETTETFVTPRPKNSLSVEFFNGSEYERSYPSTAYQVIPKSNWNDWESNPNILHYQNTIYPSIISTIGKIYELSKKRLQILDLGGGSGNLAERMLSEIPQKISGVVVIDANEKLVSSSKAKEKKYPGKLTTHCIDLTENFEPSKLPQNVDVIVLSGLVAHQVLTKEAAKRVMEKCLPVLNNNGYVIAASLSPAIFDSQDYAAMGLTAYNKTLSFVMERGLLQQPITTNDFHILQKKS